MSCAIYDWFCSKNDNARDCSLDFLFIFEFLKILKFTVNIYVERAFCSEPYCIFF